MLASFHRHYVRGVNAKLSFWWCVSRLSSVLFAVRGDMRAEVAERALLRSHYQPRRLKSSTSIKPR